MLKLHNVKIGDGGTYRMAISNKSGFTNCSACLIVKSKFFLIVNYIQLFCLDL